MSSVGEAVLRSWSVPPAASFALALTAAVYLRGWLLLRRARVPFVLGWRAICFLLGLLTVWVALASPLDTFSGFLITAHMLQHMLLMMVAPPLLLLGAPLIPLVRGLPIFARREFAGPFLRWRFAIRVGHTLTNLWFALVLMGVAMFAWHTPRLYGLALASSSWHEVEHACFFVASLIYWWPIVQPWPSRAQAPRWAVVPYLLVGDLQNTVLSAILVFSDRVLYPSYAQMPRLFGLSAPQDQSASGAIMWVVGSLAFIVPAVAIGIQCLSSRSAAGEPQNQFTRPPRRAMASGPAAHGLRRWLNTRSAEAATFIVLFAAAGLGLAALASRPSDDDDQALRAHEISGPFAISVFFASGELDAGRNTFSVLVQDRRTQNVLLDATVDLRALQEQPPRAGQGAGESLAIRASAAESENKLLQAAELDIAREGDWSLLVSVRSGRDGAEITLPLNVVKSGERRGLPWAYVVLLTLSAFLFVMYLLRHRSSRADAVRTSSPSASASGLELTRRTR